MIIMSFVVPMRLTLRNDINIGCQITLPSPKVDYANTYPINHYQSFELGT